MQDGDGRYRSVQQYPNGFATVCVIHPVDNPRYSALKIKEDSMYPCIKRGKLIVIEPDHVEEPSVDIVVNLRDGR